MKTALLVLACLLLGAAAPGAPRTILFVGNSFTFGAGSPVMRYRPDSVTDLNHDGVGGVPALFKAFTEQAGLDYAVSLETSPGKGFDFHVREKRALIARRWDVVVLQGYSTLDRDKPGDPAIHIANAKLLAEMVSRANPQVDVELVSTWTRADLTYPPGRRWSGKPVTAMALDLRAASELARRAVPDIDGIVPVGEAWNRAISAGIADPNPYDGLTYGQIDLWTWDQYHASAYGYYLEALMVFGRVTGVDPRVLGERERAANDLGLEPRVVKALQQIAFDQLQAG
ncbi:PEP-CTERM sorting domain-containing protein [Sphingomonas cannabina]|uniref:PEP-CTERM sorting domain-containing protein n=1 Tax=Sphingomonas cannabina TaxID=2899123 RepID=UPI001F221767|nr:PEP-CTERM sorting domain-containing protein [Sphingomonas cannabina]UIJ46367.1 PEP-CTERM sorting domain-containing protein [Sphingomonas cannabina]